MAEQTSLRHPIFSSVLSDIVCALRKNHGASDRQAGHVCCCRGEYRRLGHSGPLFHFSDTWQLVINTGMTTVTFLMVFVFQNYTHGQDAHATS